MERRVLQETDHPYPDQARNRLVVLGALFGFLGVAAGAFGAHWLEGRLDADALATFETAVRYQLIHALALLALAGVASARALKPRTVARVGTLFAAGIVVFSGSLYLLVFTGVGLFGAVTPVGGLCFLAGWGLLGWSAARSGHGAGPTILVLASGLAAACSAPADPLPATSAHYVPMDDGVRLAVDVNLPGERADGDRHPALIELTRYGRSHEDAVTGEPLPSLSPLDLHFLDNGYAVVKVDARGSGASFGTRSTEYGPREVLDGHAIIDWVSRQPWSDGNVGAYGTSYSGTTAELLAASGHPALKAVVPGWSDFDVYVSPARPYGLVASSFLRTWGELVGLMDSNDVEALGRSVRRVDEDVHGSLLAAAVAEHTANPDVFREALAAEYRDDRMGGEHTWADLGPIRWKAEIERSGVPMLVLVSWMDAGTAEGALLRLTNFSNPQKLIVMASSHGGGSHASPYTVTTEPIAAIPSAFELFAARLHFFDHYLKGVDNGTDGWPTVRYFNLGEEAFRATWSWPPRGASEVSFGLGAEGTLEPLDAASAGQTVPGADVYAVDATVTTGARNRWMTQMGQPVLGLHDRGSQDERMLTYTTAPLEQDLQITGTPVLALRLSSDRSDGVVLAYLEDVDADGRSIYLTEGGLRLVHRRTAESPVLRQDFPYRTFARRDAEPMIPGQLAEVSFPLWPISALVRRGHRLRLAIAGADADTFDPIPADGRATLTVHRGGGDGSRLTLPILGVGPPG